MTVRVQLYDSSSAAMVRDVVVPEDDWTAVWEGVDLGDEVRSRVFRPADGGRGWAPPGPWTDPPLDLVLGPRRPPPAAIDPQAPPGALLLFTIDTEGSVARQRDPDPARVVDDLIFGGSHGAGIGLHMDLLEHVGARGCFFLDVLLEHAFGRTALERVVAAILERGHELQLHVHADHLRHSSDPVLRRLARGTVDPDPTVFPALIEHSADLFERRVGVRPVAYRAGAYRISDEHFAALAAQGIGIDASVQTWFNPDVSGWMRARTQPHWVGDVLATPVTWFLREDEGALPSPRAFAPGGVAAGTVLATDVPGREPFVASFVSHSFQLLRVERPEDPAFGRAWNARLREHVAEAALRLHALPEDHRFVVHDGTPDAVMIASAARLLRRVAERPDARCVTYAELLEAARSGDWWRGPRASPVDPVPAFDIVRGQARTAAIRVTGPDGAGRAARVTIADAPLDVRGRTVAWVGPRTPLTAWVQERAWRLTVVDDPAAAPPGSVDLVLWAPGPGLAPGGTLGARLAQARALCRIGGTLLLGVDVLGAPTADALLHPAVDAADGPPVWDVPTCERWLARHGVGVQDAIRVPRSAEERAALAAWPGRVARLDAAEAGTASVWFAPAGDGAGAPSPPAEPWAVPAAGNDGPPALEGLDRLDPEALSRAARAAYAALEPGACATATVGPAGPCTPTSVLAALQRAGFEVLEVDGDPDRADAAVTLTRPFELHDIQRYAAAKGT